MLMMKIKFYYIILAFFLLHQHVYCLDNPEEFLSRRKLLSEKINDGVAVLMSAPVYIRNGDVEHDYRQESNFYYLTGFEEPKSAAIIDCVNSEFILFVQPENPLTEIWTGKVHGVENAKKIFRADQCFEISGFEEKLKTYISSGRKIYYLHSDKELKKLIGSYGNVSDLKPVLSEIRLIKSEYEVSLLRKAIDITCDALIDLMKKATPGMYEYQLQAVVEYNFRDRGSPRNGFPSIIGSGANSCILHYTTNRRKTEDGDIVLADVGAEFGYYTADITRTFPINGKFSNQQKVIYELVLSAQKEAIEFIKPGVKFYQIDSIARAVIKVGLVNLGILSPDENVMKYFMHGTCHWLGLDVHDAGSYNSPDGVRGGQILKPGMVLTVEPGIYISQSSGADKKWHNIGVRIEDDILVTENGYENLSVKVPKEISEIESLMSE
jgi:Xaa-Pro aminopeptidase